MNEESISSLSAHFCASLLEGLFLPDMFPPRRRRVTHGLQESVSAQGNVEARRAGQTQWQPARLNDIYCAGDRIQVGERSRADVVLVNQPLIRLDQNSTITLGGVREERTSLIELAQGSAVFFQPLPRNLEMITAFVNAGVEGTEGLVRVEADQNLHIDIRREGVGCEPGRESHAHRRSVGSSRAGQSAHIDGRGASSGCRPMGVILPTHPLFSP